jgi:hypothetical protein
MNALTMPSTASLQLALDVKTTPSSANTPISLKTYFKKRIAFWVGADNNINGISRTLNRDQI